MDKNYIYTVINESELLIDSIYFSLQHENVVQFVKQIDENKYLFSLMFKQNDLVEIPLKYICKVSLKSKEGEKPIQIYP